MRVVFLGSGEFAVPTLRAILAAGHDIPAVYTQPARPAGRGGRLRHTPVSLAAAELGLVVAEEGNINRPEAVASLRACHGDVLCVVDYGQKVNVIARQAAPHGAFNLHASLLPELRGAAPVNWAIIRGHRTTGVTTFALVDRMDAGPIYLQKSTEIGPMETAGELKHRLADLGAQLVCETLGQMAAGWLEAAEQEEEAATHAPKLDKADGYISWVDPADQIASLVHGCYPWPGGRTVFYPRHGKVMPITLIRVEVADGLANVEPGHVDDEGCISTGHGVLRIRQLKPAGKREMDWNDFVNGYRVQPGDAFIPVVS